MTPTHPQDLSLRQQAASIATGAVSPNDLLDQTLRRIAERDGAINSVVETFPSESRRMAAGAPAGPLHGVPITIKDMFCVPWRGLRNGTRHELRPPSASGVYRRLRDAGAVIVGINNQHELGMGTTGTVSAYGPAANPWALDRCAGGSSGGSAAAVAAGLAAGSVGSDSGGSTRVPAAYCGVLGLKLTYRAVPYDGYTGAGSSFSAPGLFARDAWDLGLLTGAVLARPLKVGDGSALRIGVVPEPFWADVDAPVVEACQQALRESGWAIEEIAVAGAELSSAAGSLRLASELVPFIPSALLEDLSPTVRAMIRFVAVQPAQLVVRADRVRAVVRRSLAAAFDQVDLLAWPTVPAPAPPIADPTVRLPSGRRPADLANVGQVIVANLAGVPDISLPVGHDRDGLPIGLQLIGPWGSEERLLDAALHLEAATHRRHVQRRPPVP